MARLLLPIRASLGPRRDHGDGLDAGIESGQLVRRRRDRWIRLDGTFEGFDGRNEEMREGQGDRLAEPQDAPAQGGGLCSSSRGEPIELAPGRELSAVEELCQDVVALQVEASAVPERPRPG